MSEQGNIQRVELINYKNDAGKELLGLGIEVRVLMDPQVVSGVNVTPLQQSGCCG